MKANIHPTWYGDAKVTCACGTTFTVGSTMPEIHLEVCSNCHPFYTGESKYIDILGRVEKFQARQRMAKPTSNKSKAENIEAEVESPKSLKDILKEIKTQPE